MSFYLAPLFITSTQFTANTGQPLSGGFIYSYLAGTTTPAATATSNTGGANNSNPIQLDVTGRLTQEIWLPAGQPYKFVLTDGANNQIGPTYDNISGINDITGDIQTVNVINSVSSADTANAASANSARWAYNHATDAYNQANNASTTANAAAAAANSSGIGVYDSGVLVLTAKGLNFQNTAGANIAVTANGTLTDIHVSANAASQNLSANGYTTLPGGAIMQWGQFNCINGGASETFPTPFPTALFSIVLTWAYGSPDVGYFSATSPTGFTYNNGNSGLCYWQAIGK